MAAAIPLVEASDFAATTLDEEESLYGRLDHGNAAHL
jgi:hypothetical protein